MRHRLAGALGVQPARVNVRATTTDRLASPARRGPCRAGSRAPRARVKLYSQAERPELLERRAELGDTWTSSWTTTPLRPAAGIASTRSYPDSSSGCVDDDDRLIAESNAVAIPFGPGELPDARLGCGARVAFAGETRESGLRDRDHDRSRPARPAAQQGDARRDAKGSQRPRPRGSRGTCRPSLKHTIRWPRSSVISSGAARTAALDPWLRVHEDAGAKLIRVAPESMRISGSRAEWEDWTKLGLPGHGTMLCRVRSSRSRSTASGTRASTSSPTSGCTTGLGRQATSSPAVDEAVPERRRRLRIERSSRCGLRGDLPQQPRPPLTERAFERRLLAGGS